MSQQIKKFWFRIAAVSLGLYFAPIGHLILSLFGVRTHTGRAYAGIITCVGGGESATMECDGASGNYIPGNSVQCVCGTNSAQVTEVSCEEERGSEDMWSDDRGQAYWKVVRNCYYPDACSPNGSTQDCSSTKQYCTKTCTNGRWGPSVWGNCKSGYIKVNSSCLAECTVSNGKGYESTEYDSSSSSSSEA